MTLIQHRSKIVSVLGLIALTGVALWFLRSLPAMPLDEETMEQFLEISSRHVEQLQREQATSGYYENNAEAFRRSMAQMGYDPEKSLRWWLSPEFQDAIQRDQPNEAVHLLRRAGSIISMALADGASDASFETVIHVYSTDLQTVARERRAGR